MALNASSNVGFTPRFSAQNLLSFPKINSLMFAAQVAPVISTPLNINVGPSPFDTFQLGNQPAGRPQKVQIVLSSATGLKSRIAESLSQFSDGLRMHMQRDADSAPTVAEALVDKMATVLADALSPGKEIDSLGNTYAVYQTKKSTGENSAGTKNLQAMVTAFKAKLQALPEYVREVSVDIPDKLPDGVDRAVLIRELSEAVTLSAYNYRYHRQSNIPTSKLRSVTFTKPGQTTATGSAVEGQTVGEAINFARHFVDAGANLKTTQYISQKASELQSPTLNVNVREGAWLEGDVSQQQHLAPEDRNDKRMGLFLSVAQGSQAIPEKAPRLVEMVYTPADGKYTKTILLVGKGIVYDTGGNNLKTGEFIHAMEGDMAGAAAVIATMKALDALKLQGVRVIGLTPLTENRMGSAATLPNDIYTARNGKTVQISNTDAEGRLVLADAMHYGMERYQPDVVADIATLTGGKVRGVGAQNAVALSGNNPDLMTTVQGLERGMSRKAEVIGLTAAHRSWVTRGGKGKADVFNSVNINDAKLAKVFGEEMTRENPEYGRQHSAQGAAFLREFLPDPTTPWVHYDMAGAEFDKPDPKRGNEEWATGFGVKDLYALVKGIAEGNVKPSRNKTEILTRSGKQVSVGAQQAAARKRAARATNAQGTGFQ